MRELINKVLSDPWIVAFFTWAVRLFLLCLLAGLVRVIYGLIIAPIIQFPYPTKGHEIGRRKWSRGFWQRIEKVKLKLPWVEAEFDLMKILEEIEKKRETASTMGEKDVTIETMRAELDAYKKLASEMANRLGKYEQPETKDEDSSKED